MVDKTLYTSWCVFYVSLSYYSLGTERGGVAPLPVVKGLELYTQWSHLSSRG